MESLPTTRIAYAQHWIEREAGWGERPDGFTLHPSIEAAEQFVADYTKDRTGPAPAEYNAPAGRPFAVSVAEGVEVDFQGKNGIWAGPDNRRLPEGITRL